MAHPIAAVAEVASKVGSEVAKEVAKEAASELTKEVAKEAGKEAVIELPKEIGNEAAKELPKEVGKEAKPEPLSRSEAEVKTEKNDFEQLDEKEFFEESKTESVEEDVHNIIEKEDGDHRYFTERSDRISEAKGSRGEWEGEKGCSKFKPDSDEAQEKLSEYGKDGIDYNAEGEPDFSEVSEGTVKIENMSSDRISNFSKADIKLAEKWNQFSREGRSDWTARDIKDFRHSNKLSWHERLDMETMDLVPYEIHSECKHWGGVSECRRAEAVKAFGGNFNA